ncbi:MAG: T9SS type A sorting domain-containing protein [Candidatus Marinimicrobia bacterium]|nr:T9SS type A sorting domain-containing protein [Candidatus Neomarinimicrobiota bacterium]
MPFNGTYDGDGKIISGLYINRSGQYYFALFGLVGSYGKNAAIKNLGVTNVNVTGLAWYVGGLVGFNQYSTIENCYSTGAVTGNDDVGGLVGGNWNSATITNSYSTCTVTGYQYVGGLAGSNNWWGEIENCYSRGNVTRTGSSETRFGGFVGYNLNYSTIDKCYSTGSVYYSGTTDPNDKGFVGQSNGGTFTNNFWDSEASNQSTGTGATGKTTAEMTNATTTNNIYLAAGWDFKGESTNGTVEIWNIGNGKNDGYPYLDWQYPEDDASLPVELTSFTAECRNGGVLLKWSTESEIENLGFLIEKQILDTGCWMEIAGYLNDAALEGHGSTTEAHEYQFTDNAVQPGVTYEYRLGDVDYNGKVTWHKKIEVKVKAEDVKIPVEFGLHKAYPNPFNPAVTLSYGLKEAGQTTLQVFNLRGQLVETLVSAYQLAGTYKFTWQPENLGAGVYIIRFQSGRQTNLQKVVFVK